MSHIVIKRLAEHRSKNSHRCFNISHIVIKPININNVDVTTTSFNISHIVIKRRKNGQEASGKAVSIYPILLLNGISSLQKVYDSIVSIYPILLLNPSMPDIHQVPIPRFNISHIVIKRMSTLV